MKTSLIVLFLVELVYSSLGSSQHSPGARFTLTKDFLTNFIHNQLPTIFNGPIFIPEISRNTSHKRFLMNITNISIKNLDLRYLKSEINFDPQNKKIIIDLG
jgi:hypothetical protein